MWCLQVVGTREGEVLIVQEGEVRQTLRLDGGCGVTTLAAFSRVRHRAAGPMSLAVLDIGGPLHMNDR